jgi:cyclopropane-fatty-acyl-phospholipid synthase
MNNSTPSSSNDNYIHHKKSSFFSGMSRRFVHHRLKGLTTDRLIISEGDDSWEFGSAKKDVENIAKIFVHDPRCYSEVAFGGTIGAGEAYMKGYWETDDLTGVIRILLRNRKLLNNMDTGLSRFSEPANKLFHWWNRNSKSGSRKNISAHYDLGNEFFRLWLDDSLMYSSAVFEDPLMTLEEASLAKMRKICEKLRLSSSDELLEIGAGWGSLAIYAAKKYGCRVTTTTISQEQYSFVLSRVKEEGLEDQVTVLNKDYRDLIGQFDKLVSIEMLEAIGHEFIDTYFEKCNELLKPNGRMLLQTITIDHSEYERAKKSVDFIQKYIFPGGCLSSVQVLTDSVTRVSNLFLHHLEEIGLDYAMTIQHWRQRMFERISDIRSLGYSEEFIRMWEFYFCYCEGGFIERAIGDVQILLLKPDTKTNIN